MKFAKTAAIAALFTVAFALPTFAADDVVNKALDSLELHLGSAIACQPVMGVAYVEDARSKALVSLEAFGMGESDAALIIARAEQAVQRDAQKAAKTLAATPVNEASQFCQSEYARTGEVFTVAMAGVADAFN